MAAQRKTPSAGEQPRATFKQSKWRQFNRLVLQVATDPWLAALIALALWLKVSSAQAYATIPPALKGAGASNTISVEVAATKVKRGFVMSESFAGAGVSGARRHSCGQDEPIRKDGCTATDVLLTSCPPYALSKATGGFFTVPVGA